MGRKIREYRESKNLTQLQVANAAGVSVGAVSQWENGRCSPNAIALLRIAKLFECSPEELVDDEEKNRIS